jgi:hypothetical protein
MTDQTAAHLGRTLLSIQLVEFLLEKLLQTVFHDETVPTVREIERASAPQQHNTLGQLMTRLRERVELHPELSRYLKEFLCNRNRFVHRLFFESPKGVSDEAVERYYLDCSREVLRDSVFLIQLFVGQFVRWFQALRPNVPMDEETKLIMRQAEAFSGGMQSLDQLFRSCD